MGNNYVISVKRVKTYSGDVLKPEEQYFEYAGLDNYAGSFSSGYPVFLYETHAERFKTVEDAEKWWNSNKKYLLSRLREDNYDINTLAIRKCVYSTKKKLTV